MKLLSTAALVSAFAIATSFAVVPGDKAPDFTAKTAKGEEVSLEDYKGKIVVLEWTNFECPFVQKHYSGKNMQNLQKDYTGQGVVWLTVNSSAEGKQGYLEASELDKKVTDEGSMASDVLIDTDGKIGKAYDAKVTPHMMIIDKDGKIAYTGAIDSKSSTDAADVESADKLFANALDAVINGDEVPNAKNEPYGCSVKY